MCDPAELGRAHDTEQALYAEIKALVARLLRHQRNDALDEYDAVDNAIVALQQAMMFCEQANGHLALACSTLDEQLERRRHPGWLEAAE